MDKSYAIPYPQVDAKMDTDSVENRLNTSREALRLRMRNPEANTSDASNNPEESVEGRPINSWSSLLMNLISPPVRRVATQHPYALIGGSAIAGAYLVWAKPWRGVLGSVIVGAVIRNLVTASFSAGSRQGGRILQHYLNRTPVKKYAPYQKQEHAQVNPGTEA